MKKALSNWYNPEDKILWSGYSFFSVPMYKSAVPQGKFTLANNGGNKLLFILFPNGNTIPTLYFCRKNRIFPE